MKKRSAEAAEDAKALSDRVADEEKMRKENDLYRLSM